MMIILYKVSNTKTFGGPILFENRITFIRLGIWIQVPYFEEALQSTIYWNSVDCIDAHTINYYYIFATDSNNFSTKCVQTFFKFLCFFFFK